MQSPPLPQLNAEHLSHFNLFKGISHETLNTLAESLPVRRVEAGSTVVNEGDTSTEMFMVVSGELEVVKGSDVRGDIRVAVLGPGDWFGEMSLLESVPRSATVLAVAPTLLLCISPEDLKRYLEDGDPKDFGLFMKNVAKALGHKLRIADGILAQFFTAVSQQYTKPPPSH